MDILDEIKQVSYDEHQYYKATYDKAQIVLHHTVSNGSAKAVINYWESKPDRVGTCVIIDKDGVIHQLFDSRFYAGHIGNVSREMKQFKLPYRSCSKNSIGIELINMGGLVKKGDKYYDSYGGEFKGEVVHYLNGYRGYDYFAKYTDKQIASLKKLLLYWCKHYGIPTTYHNDMWDVNIEALSGEKGIFSHTSFRYGKSDVHPQEELISMLRSL